MILMILTDHLAIRVNSVENDRNCRTASLGGTCEHNLISSLAWEASRSSSGRGRCGCRGHGQCGCRGRCRWVAGSDGRSLSIGW